MTSGFVELFSSGSIFFCLCCANVGGHYPSNKRLSQLILLSIPFIVIHPVSTVLILNHVSQLSCQGFSVRERKSSGNEVEYLPLVQTVAAIT